MLNREMPIGIQDFEKLRSENYVYVDKTADVFDLAKRSTPYFLSRPRRFGKSLLLSTLKAYFLGKKDLFNGLAIAKLERDWTEYPVFYLDLNTGIYDSRKELETELDKLLFRLEDKWGDDGRERTLQARFEGLIIRACEKTGKKVVVLVDEYDKPLISSLEKGETHDDIKTALKAFYSVLKSADPYLRFVFLTGVTKFSQVSVFSDLNHLRDISMLKEYSGICGITETELVENFNQDIITLAEKNGASYEKTLELLRKNFNGYRFSRNSEGVYNPFSILNTFANKAVTYYWFQTGTPTFLVKQLQTVHFDIRQFSNGAIMRELDIVDYRYGKNPVPLLYQTGYLTIKEYDANSMSYSLIFPNEEVKYGFLESLLPRYIPIAEQSGFFIKNFFDDLENNDIDGVMRRFRAFFSSMPYDLTDKFDKEKDYQMAFYLVFTLLGQWVETEVRSILGRADAVVKTKRVIYVFEFKLSGGGSVMDALWQIDEKGYLIPYTADGRKIVKVGVVFDEKERNIADWKAVDCSV
jgi:hypothetical protein